MQALHNLVVFTDKHLGRSWKVLRHGQSLSLSVNPACSRSVCFWFTYCTYDSKKVDECGNGFVLWMVTHCMPVNAVFPWVLILVLTLRDIFKANRIELGVCFRLHNMVFGYYMQKNEHGIYSLLLKPAVHLVCALCGSHAGCWVALSL